MSKLISFGILLTTLIVVNEVTCSTCSSKSEQQCSRPSRENVNHVNIILFGATGNLAKKYLWNSLFEVYKTLVDERKEFKFSIYAVSRDDKKEGRKFISDFLLNLEKCSTDKCMDLKKGFSEIIQYIKLVTAQDFKELESKLDENTQSLYGMVGSARSNEVGRLFYLAIPPSAYGKTTQKIHKYLMPKVGHPWVRIVIEKPFGGDLDTAVALNDEIMKSFNESQIYRVDHYLGKTVVKGILPFRIINSEKYDRIWNSDHVERIEVVMMEDDDVVGRTGFYNENGVLRDVMQNHMTEMLCLVAMELPSSGGSNISELHALKSDLITKLRISSNESARVITGQYSTYNAEWLAENQGSNQVTDVATFAATSFRVDADRWRGVPIVMTSGKKLGEKSSYVRVLFKNNRFCSSLKSKRCRRQEQLVFYVGGRLGEGIAVSSGLPVPEFKSNWAESKATGDFGSTFFGQAENVRLFTPKKTIRPYTHLIQAALEGARHLFIPMETLQESWKFWSPLIKTSETIKPRKYSGRNKDPERLEFVITGPSCTDASMSYGVEFFHDERKILHDQNS